MDRETVLREVQKIPEWYHCLDFGNGIVTPGYSATKWGQSGDLVGLPARLDGKSVLDVGAWDGFYSFESERRGAARVLATDSFVWTHQKAGFLTARRLLQSRVEDLDIDVLDLRPDRVGVFDVVLFLGVLYHMRHPLLALERVASVAGDHLILETHVDMLDVPRPAMAFYPTGELNNDQTNWCGPNPPMILAMLKTVGFSRAEVFAGPFEMPTSTRMIFHAWK
jgi:tRNA (mo5U34)-methyltransferase